jgi:hypothetical protein
VKWNFVVADHKTRWNKRLGSPSTGSEIFLLQEYGYITRKTRRITRSSAALSSSNVLL